jgi:hypothetical protein
VHSLAFCIHSTAAVSVRIRVSIIMQQDHVSRCGRMIGARSERHRKSRNMGGMRLPTSKRTLYSIAFPCGGLASFLLDVEYPLHLA